MMWEWMIPAVIFGGLLALWMFALPWLGFWRRATAKGQSARPQALKAIREVSRSRQLGGVP